MTKNLLFTQERTISRWNSIYLTRFTLFDIQNSKNVSNAVCEDMLFIIGWSWLCWTRGFSTCPQG